MLIMMTQAQNREATANADIDPHTEVTLLINFRDMMADNSNDITWVDESVTVLSLYRRPTLPSNNPQISVHLLRSIEMGQD